MKRPRPEEVPPERRDALGTAGDMLEEPDLEPRPRGQRAEASQYLGGYAKDESNPSTRVMPDGRIAYGPAEEAGPDDDEGDPDVVFVRRPPDA